MPRLVVTPPVSGGMWDGCAAIGRHARVVAAYEEGNQTELHTRIQLRRSSKSVRAVAVILGHWGMVSTDDIFSTG